MTGAVDWGKLAHDAGEAAEEAVNLVWCALVWLATFAVAWVFGGQHGAPVAQANAHARTARNRHRARKGRPVREAPDDDAPPPRRPRARTGGAGGGGGGGGGGWAPPRPAPTRGADGRFQPARQDGERDPLDDELANLDDEQNPDETEQNQDDDGLPDVDLPDIEPAGNDR